MHINKNPFLVILSVILILQFATACSSSTRGGDGETWVIFSAAKAKELGVGNWIANGVQINDYWTPSEKEILTLEKELITFLREHPDRFSTQERPIWNRLDEYNRQYIGIILDGKSIVYANYFCNSMDKNWKEEFVLILDGGDCYFQFKFDPKTGEFFGLQVNGEA